MARTFNLRQHQQKLAANVTAPGDQQEMAEELRVLVKQNLMRSLRGRGYDPKVDEGHSHSSEWIEPPQSFTVVEVSKAP